MNGNQTFTIQDKPKCAHKVFLTSANPSPGLKPNQIEYTIAILTVEE